jgi:predicted aspartyl protease
MPLLHSQFGGQGKTQDGKIVQLPGPAGLVHRGPCVPIIISVPDQLGVEFAKQGRPVPTPISGLALIDTGAGSTCIDEDVAKKLGLPVVNIVNMASASHASNKANVYPAKLQITGLPMGISAPSAIGAALAAQNSGLVALIGRDLLARFVLIYNGAIGEVTLCI